MKTIASVLAVVVCACAQAGTLGLWTFNGHEDGETATYGVIPKVAGTTTCELCLTNSNTETVQMGAPSYSSSVPAITKLYNDCALTNHVCDLTSSLYLSYKNQNNRSVANCLRLAGIGRELKGHDFTIEIIARVAAQGFEKEDYYGHKGNIISLSGAAGKGSPAIGYCDYNQGALFYFKNDTSDNWNGDQTKTWTQSQNDLGFVWADAKWRHLAISYSAANSTATVYLDYRPMVYSLSLAGIGGIQLDDDSMLQILGPGGQTTSTNSHPWAYVAAVRVSDKVLSRGEYLALSTGAEAFASDPTVGWWRFESGLASGTPVANGVIRNERKRAMYDDLASVYTWSGNKASRWSQNVPTSPVLQPSPYPCLTIGDDVSTVRTNCTCVGSASTANNKGIGLVIPYLPEVSLPGSFTAEVSFMLTQDISAGYPSDGWRRHGIMGTRFSESGFAWNLRVLDGKLALAQYTRSSSTGALIGNWSNAACTSKTMELNRWYHAAVVYDADSTPKKLSLYLDRQLVGTKTYAAGTELMGSMGEFYLPGGLEAGSPACFWGSVDEARWTRAVLQPSQFLRLRKGLSTLVIVR